MTEEAKTISYDKTGRIRVNIDGTTHVIRPPNYGEFKRVKNTVIEAQNIIDKRLSDLGVDKDNQEELNKHPELVEVTLDALAAAILYVFNGSGPIAEVLGEWKGLSSESLPKDVDEWPTWLIVNTKLIQDFIAHWREVPLARG